jgi:hypothetical protein
MHYAESGCAPLEIPGRPRVLLENTGPGKSATDRCSYTTKTRSKKLPGFSDLFFEHFLL